MHFHIEQILLYPKDSKHAVRELSFAEGEISIVSGLSRRGKSAITHIIDYCLGSRKCSIPLGPIRSTVAWYALLVRLESRWIFIARQEPGGQQATDHYCVHHLEFPALPLSVAKNTGKDAFKDTMNDLCGVPRLSLSGQSAANYRDSRPSFRDFAAFNFLPQHIVANPQALFYKTDSTGHKEKLIHIFPFVLNAVSAQYLIDESEASDLDKRIKQEEERINLRRLAVEQQQDLLHGLAMRAFEYGLLHASPDLSNNSSTLITLLEGAIERAKSSPLEGPSDGATESSIQRLSQLKDDESEAARQVGNAKRELMRLESLSGAIQNYTLEFSNQTDRAKGVTWYRARVPDNTACPMCGTESDAAAKILDSLRASYEASLRRVEALSQGPTRFEKEIARVKKNLRDQESQLREVREKIAVLQGDHTEIEDHEQRSAGIYRFVGQVEATLQLIVRSDASNEPETLQGYRNELSVIRDRMAHEDRKSKEGAALNRISRLIREYAHLLQLERRDDEHLLVPKDLALTFKDSKGRVDYLWELGSGENWMGYHLAVMLALHEFFLHLPNSPVLSYLVIDQPTQVYFPARDSYEELRSKNDSSLGESSDISSARRIFVALAEALNRTKGRLQIIVTEHADDLTWGSVPNVVSVADWREDRFLIPPHWYSAPSPND